MGIDKKVFVPPHEIIQWAAEYLSGYNDGWTKEHYREKLAELRDYLNNILANGIKP